MFVFKGKWYNDLSEKEIDISGVVSGSTYVDAMTSLSNYYGDSLLLNISLFPLEDGDELIELKPEICDLILEDS